MREEKISNLNATVCLNFLDKTYCITTFKKLTSSKMTHVRAVNILVDYQLHGIILTRVNSKVYTYHPSFQNIFQGYIDFERQSGISESTLRSHSIYLERFSDYLVSQKIYNLKNIDNALVLGFSNTFVTFSPSVIHCTLCSLRTFFRYLYHQKIILKDFSSIVPSSNYRKQSKIPSAYSKKEISTLLESIDRGNPKGKRDYAMILLAARLGLRAKDICDLNFKNLKWENNTIELIQSKTKKLIVLPLLKDIGMAIIDYLKHSRPDVQVDNVFLRLVSPIKKLESPTLHSIVTHHMCNAGIKIDSGRKHGPHALRHSLASALLEDNIPLPVISEVLGHTNTNSTFCYLKIDINQLRNCSLQALPFYWNKNKEEF